MIIVNPTSPALLIIPGLKWLLDFSIGQRDYTFNRKPLYLTKPTCKTFIRANKEADLYPSRDTSDQNQELCAQQLGIHGSL